MVRAPRWLHRVRAHASGHVWTLCPVCGQGFGGHERGGQLATGTEGGVPTCSRPDCLAETVRRNKINWDAVVVSESPGPYNNDAEAIEAFRPEFPKMLAIYDDAGLMEVVK